MKTVLITGAGTGLGRATAEYLSKNGYQVFAGVNHHDEITDPNIKKISLNVSNTEAVEEAYSLVSSMTDHLDAIINFAGFMVMGSLIEEDPSVMEKILNVNVMGMVRVNKIFFPLLEKVKGRIVNISSECGIYGATPFNGFYTASKHAVEMYSDALRRELCYLGVKVIKIRPGAFKTKMQDGTKATFDNMLAKTTHYPSVMKKMGSLAEKQTGKIEDPIKLAKLIYKVLNVKKPKIAYNINIAGEMKMMNIFSDSMQDKLYQAVVK